MSDDYSRDLSHAPSFEDGGFSEVSGIVESEFDVEEGLIEYGLPTFTVRLRQDSKRGFLRLAKKLDAVGYILMLRRSEGKSVLKIFRKKPVAHGRWKIIVGLFLATIVTTLITGYFLSTELAEMGWISHPMVGAVMFTVSIMAILGVHELGHKLAASKHGVRASYPYFIPGPPVPYGFGTFGAVIRLKSLVPNKDTLFDLGLGGPLGGFIVTVIVTAIGIQLSPIVSTAPPDATSVPLPLLFEALIQTLALGRLLPGDNYLLLHPVAFAGWIGMLVTMLQLLPVGSLDGGHVARSLLGEKTRKVFSVLSILLLMLLGYYSMAILAVLLSSQRHPGSLDEVSTLSRGRKASIFVLIIIFVLCISPVLIY